jgi:hypothetical protein
VDSELFNPSNDPQTAFVKWDVEINDNYIGTGKIPSGSIMDFDSRQQPNGKVRLTFKAARWNGNYTTCTAEVEIYN